VAITLGAFVFDAAHTRVREAHEEVGGRRERSIEISGVIVDVSTEAAVHAALDAILDASSTVDYSATLSIRADRRMFVRRAAFVRNVSTQPLAGAFTLKLVARDPHEESVVLHSVPWSIDSDGDTIALSTLGNTTAPARIRCTALGTLVSPSFGIGATAIVYDGIVGIGEELVLDGITKTAAINGVDVTPYVSGVFLEIAPEGSAILYTGAPSSAHLAAVTVEYRDRWW